MDEASRLVSELHNKLEELDLRVWRYRRDMASEFTKHAEDLLRNVPKEISETVSKVIAEDMKTYKSLNPDATPPVESDSAGSHQPAHGFHNTAQPYLADSTTTVSYTMQSDPDLDSPRVPHEREYEFQGLFTPSYLPLLDSTSRENQSRSNIGGDTLDKGKEKEMAGAQADVNTGARSLSAELGLQRQKPKPKRRSTEELSLASDSSDGHLPRSALRRSESASKLQSPRRVRFDVMGEEVLPTASPLPQKNSSPPGLGDVDDKGESEQIEDIEAPPKKKMSSTKALQALSRGPLEEDGTQWTTVSSGPDGEPANESGDNQMRTSTASLASKSGLLDIAVANATIKNSYSELGVDDKDDTETPSDDGTLDMPPLAPIRSQRSTTGTPPPIKVTTTTRSTNSTAPSGRRWLSLDNLEQRKEGEEDEMFLEDDSDPMFRFDESGHEERSPEEVNEESDPESPESPEIEKEPADLGYSRSPALEIPTRLAPQPASVPTPLKGVVGSYKGRPFSMPIASDEIHAQAASLGVVNSFVGSLNGRSGLDESDVQSFRDSFKTSGSFTGTPKSLTERMMMEDLLEAEEAQHG